MNAYKLFSEESIMIFFTHVSGSEISYSWLALSHKKTRGIKIFCTEKKYNKKDNESMLYGEKV